MDTLKIGKFIARCRKEKKMTQEDLAKILGVTNKTISRWENGNYMPDLSLLKPLSEVLGISLNELLSGEKDINVQKADENIFNITNYSRLAIEKVFKHIYIALMFLGLFLIISALLVTEPESSFGAIYTTIGLCMFIIGFNHCLKKYKVIWQWVLTFAVTLFCIGCLLFFDYVNVVENRSVPRFRLSVIYTSDNILEYKTLFYNVFRLNIDTPNEYYIVDKSKKYNFSTVPKSPFNLNKSGIDNIMKYKNKYIGNNSNTGGLINSLPLSDYGYVFEIDDTNLIINYDMTKWYYNDDLYVDKALIYNSVCFFVLIDNLDSITYNFSGSTYYIDRDMVVKNYPNYSKLIKDNKVNKNNFNKYVLEKINDDEFVKDVFDKIG